jgi:hypothetical protein
MPAAITARSGLSSTVSEPVKRSGKGGGTWIPEQINPPATHQARLWLEKEVLNPCRLA